MSDPYLGEIKMVGFNFAPVGWSTCQGQTLAIAAYSALFALLGTTFGGNGTSTFQLPDLQGRVPLGQGTGPGLPAYVWGEKGGQNAVTLTQQQMPQHSHPAAFAGTGGGNAPVTVSVQGSSAVANSSSPNGNYLAGQTGASRSATDLYVTPAQAGTPAAIAGTSSGSVALPAPTGSVTIQNSGGNQPFSIQPPYLCLYFIIAMQGIFPSRS
jgi:microcystin-dependent protein